MAIPIKIDDEVIACASYVCRVMQVGWINVGVNEIVTDQLQSLKLFNVGKLCACKISTGEVLLVNKKEVTLHGNKEPGWEVNDGPS